MYLTILSTQQKKTIIISWIEVETAAGNFVIQKNHAPTILAILPNQPINMCLSNGKQETFQSPGGILEITREKAILLLDE